jgi:LysM repeat protein
MSTFAIPTTDLNVRRHTAQMALPVRRPTAATYRRRRLVVGGIMALLAVCGGLVVNEVLAGASGVTASAASAGPAPVRSTVTAQPGDTLWSIARAYRGEIDVDRYLDRLITLNGGTSIQVGQAVVLP